jgi:monoamine oxidase
MAFMDAEAIVIGAGAAGLSAARRLAARHHRVVLVEARDRAGGRIWSCPRAGKAVSAELGAEFIHGRAPETIELLREVGSSAIPIASGEFWTCDGKGTLKREQNEFREAAALFDQAASLETDESVEQFLRRFAQGKATCEQLEWARDFVEGFDAADPKTASVQSIAQEWQSGVDSASARPRGGYAPIVTHLQNACIASGVQLLLSTTVRRIVWQRGSVVVHATNDQYENLSFQARTAVVTLPAGVLRHRGDDAEVFFEPALPPEQREALPRIEMGPVVKVALWFRSAFWEHVASGRYRNGAFFHCDRQTFKSYWTQQPMRSELIVAWAGGPKAAVLNGAPASELIESARDGFGALFGDVALARKQFEGGLMHDWSRDPFARGAYSYVLVGGVNARAMLALPVENTLFFAGEATSTDGQGGTVNGALETGQRAAAEAARSLEKSTHA